MVPGHNESAGKRKSSKTKKGNKYLRSSLTEAAHSLIVILLTSIFSFLEFNITYDTVHRRISNCKF